MVVVRRGSFPGTEMTSSMEMRMNTQTRTDQSRLTKHQPTALVAGVAAPDFTLKSTPDQTVALSDFRGKPVVLVFYPADWSPVCSDQLALYNELLPEFSEFEAEVIGISVDGIWCHLAFSKDRKFHTPLLADFEPKGAVARLYGVYNETSGEAERALFVIDSAGV